MKEYSKFKDIKIGTKFKIKYGTAIYTKLSDNVAGTDRIETSMHANQLVMEVIPA